MVDDNETAGTVDSAESPQQGGVQGGVGAAAADEVVDGDGTSIWGRIGNSVVLQFVVSIIAPGVAAVRRAPLVALALFVAGVVLPLGLMFRAFANRDDLIGFALDERLLVWVTVIGVLAVIARVAAVAEVAVRHRASPNIMVKTSVAAVVLIALSVPSAIVLSQVNHTREVVGDVFSSSDDDTPLFSSASDDDVADEPTDTDTDTDSDTDADTDVEEDDDIEPTAEQSPDATVAPDDEAGGEEIDPDAIRTTLLLGGDDGPGRWGVRTDSMILFMVHEATGRSALISIPRNLMRLQFPPETPLGEDFPNGFNDFANAVFTHVRTRPELIEAYASSEPSEVVALTQGIGYSLDVTIDDYVLVNMQAFKDVVDAVGGVTVNVPKRVLLQRTNPVGDYDPPEAIGPGRVDLDGTLAIAYVRARRGDSDYFRMSRQRDVLAALGSQVTTRDAINAFPKVADALEDSMKTSLSSSEFSDLLDRLGDSARVGETVGLAPPLITPSRPDFDNVKSIVAAVRNYVRTGEASGYDS